MGAEEDFGYHTLSLKHHSLLKTPPLHPACLKCTHGKPSAGHHSIYHFPPVREKRYFVASLDSSMYTQPLPAIWHTTSLPKPGKETIKQNGKLVLHLWVNMVACIFSLINHVRHTPYFLDRCVLGFKFVSVMVAV